MSQTIKLDAGKRNFCRAYLERPDAEYAARESGVKDGWKTLESEEVQRCLERARQSAWESIRLEDVVRRLCQIAFSRPNDAVALACGVTCKSVAELDLLAVAEFKSREGAAEVKFLDRVRALQILGELLCGGREEAGAAARDFFQALEESAGALGADGSAAAR